MATRVFGETLDIETCDCPSCGEVGYKIIRQQADGTRYLQCNDCGTIFASPRSAHSIRFAQLEDTFSLNDYTTQIIERRRPALALEAEILSSHKNGGILLDVGCSTGVFFEYFSSEKWRKYGVELSPSAARFAARAYGADVRAGTLQAARFPENTFDLITMIDMFYYEENPNGLLCEAARVMRPDGLLGIELPGQSFQLLRGNGLICRLLDKKWTRFDSNSEYLYWYSPAGLQKLLANTGFEVVGWEVISSPSTEGFRNKLSQTYFKLMRRGVRRWPKLIAWAPKFLVLAKVKKP